MKRLLGGAALALGLLGAIALQLPEANADARAAVRVARLWSDSAAQYRTILGDVPYDFLADADRMMPRGARVLLVTPGNDVRHREYTTFHRALYFLAPRAVHWITPAAGDGTWESRWWTTVPLVPGATCEYADRVGATHLLLLDLEAPDPACAEADYLVMPLESGTLVRLRAVAGSTSSARPPSGLGAIGVLPALLIPLLFGTALIAAVTRHGTRLHPAQRLALAWILGSAVVSFSEIGLGTLGLAQSLRLAIAATVGVAVGTWLLAGRHRHSVARWIGRLRRSVSWPVALLAAVVVAELLLVGLLAAGRPLSIWDGWAIWGMKARAIFLDGHVTATVFADQTRASTHLNYPLAVPLLESWLYGWIGTPDDRLVGVLGLATYAALLAFVLGTLRRWGAGAAESIALVALLGSVVWLWRIAGAGFADVPLALALTAAGVLLVDWLSTGERGTLVLAVLPAGLLGWIKVEGVVLLAILLSLLAVLALAHRQSVCGRRARVGLAAVGIGGMALSGPWWLFVLVNGVAGPGYTLTAAALTSNLDRLPTIGSMQLSMLASGSWSYIWPVAAALAVAFVLASTGRGALRRLPRPEPGLPDGLLLATAAAALVVLSAAYLVTTYAPYTEQIESSGYRLALQVLPITFLWTTRHALPVLRAFRPPDRRQDIQPYGSAPPAAGRPAPSPTVDAQG